MKLAIERALKFLCYLLIMFSIVYGGMFVAGMSEVAPDEFVGFLSTSRGQFMIVAMLGLSALYPIYGVVVRKMTRIGTSEIILKMESNGFKMISKDDKKMAFILVKFTNRLRLRFDDRVDIDNSGDITVIKGSRRAVYTVLFKLGGDVL